MEDVFIKSKKNKNVEFQTLSLKNLIKKPITVSPNVPLPKIRQILLEKKIKRIIVVEKKIPVGIITEKDISRKIYASNSVSLNSITAKDFKSKKLYVLKHENSVTECAQLMTRHHISSVIILNPNETLAGIITKTDLASVFLTKGRTPLKVSNVMKTDLITAAPSDPILHIENMLLRYGISRIIIQRNKKPVGIITFRDFVPAKIPQWIADSADPKEVQEYKLKKGLSDVHSNQLNYLFPFHATDIMSPNPITINEDEDVALAITLMIKYGISGLPVLRKSKLVGIITKTDIVRALV